MPHGKLLLAIMMFSFLGHVFAAEPQSVNEYLRKMDTKDKSDSELYARWDPTAIQAYVASEKCIRDGSGRCPVNECASIERRLEWMGLLCRANLAQEAANKREFERNVQKSFRAIKKLLSKDQWTARQDLVNAEAAIRDQRSSDEWYTDQYLALKQEVWRYSAWAMAQAFLGKHKREMLELESKAQAGDASSQYEFALKLYNDRTVPDHYSRAATWYRKAAEQGDALAQNNLGFMYVSGIGVAKDEAQAAAWFRKAAERGNASAQNKTGFMYANGTGVDKNEAEAVVWYRKAADQGDANAQKNLAAMYENGRGIAKDWRQAVMWYRKAAEQGFDFAQLGLGIMYSKGQGVVKDDAQALVWYRKAADQGNSTAQLMLAVLYRTGDGGVTKDEAQAFGWYLKAAMQGDGLAQQDVASMYANGQGTLKDEAQALSWFRKGAEQGRADSQYSLGVMYAHGRGISKDVVQAAAWYRKAAQQGEAAAQYNLGVLYADGVGVEKDEVQAVAWFRKAAEQGHSSAQNYLGVMYETGKGGVLQDFSLAAVWFRKAAVGGESYAQRNLALFYRDGKGVSQSLVTAYAWMNLAAAAGHTSAIADRDRIGAQLSSADLHKAQKLAREWKPGELIPEVRASKPGPKPTVAKSSKAQSITSNELFPARPAKKPGVVSCRTRCQNSDCYRTYDNGEQIRFQAKRKMNAFGEWEWDSGSC